MWNFACKVVWCRAIGMPKISKIDSAIFELSPSEVGTFFPLFCFPKKRSDFQQWYLGNGCIYLADFWHANRSTSDQRSFKISRWSEPSLPSYRHQKLERFFGDSLLLTVMSIDGVRVDVIQFIFILRFLPVNSKYFNTTQCFLIF